MKRLVFIAVVLGTLLLGGCQITTPQPSAGVSGTPEANASQSAGGPSETSAAEMPQTPASPSQKPDVSPTPSQVMPSLPPQYTVTFDDQKQVEQLIRDYFGALEKKDYTLAWQMTSAARRTDYPKELALKEHWGMESVKLVTMKGYLPPDVAAYFPPYETRATDVPEGVPTIWFEVELDITPASNTAWENGKNTRFVDVVEDEDGSWRIDGLATGL